MGFLILFLLVALFVLAVPLIQKFLDADHKRGVNKILKEISQQSKSTETFNKSVYKPKKRFFSKKGRYFYKDLKNIIQNQYNNEYILTTQVRIPDIIKINKWDDKKLRNQIKSKNISFLILDGEFKPVLGIEISTAARNKPKRKKILNDIFDNIGLDLIFMKDSRDLKDILPNYLD